MEKIKLLLYCCKQPHKLFNSDKGFVLSDWDLGDAYKDKTLLNGKIVAECDFEVEELTPYQYQGLRENMVVGYKGKTTDYNALIDKSKIGYCELDNYLKCNIGYAIHIKNLHIFDKPRELNECWANTNAWIFSNEKLYVAPQNMRYCGDWNLKKAILISIRPEWLVKILNKEKTIEVRKKVLKEMLEK